jgi:hypothetical protein
MKFNCINFGGCYGYDLIAVFEEFLYKHCIISANKSSYPSLDRLAYEYISFIQENYDHSIEYLEKQNKILILKLIKIHNRMAGNTKIIVVENTITNLCLNEQIKTEIEYQNKK